MRIAILPGDGIGPEIMAQAVKVLSRLALPAEMQEAPVGGAGYAAAGEPLPAKTLALARDADAVLFGAVGDPPTCGPRACIPSSRQHRRSSPRWLQDWTS